MTLSNMSIEAGARAGMVAPDETTIAYIAGRRFAPAGDEWDRAIERWHALPSEGDAEFEGDEFGRVVGEGEGVGLPQGGGRRRHVPPATAQARGQRRHGRRRHRGSQVSD